ncbi:MAG TPA: protein kinase [Kofleriaceae bacterium]|nr:protein kinase [Kofleriaceae bacterium]
MGKALAGRYVIVRRLGEGGMGTVYVAEKLALGKHVALKILHGQLATQPEVLDRFLQEAKAASRIGHPHVIDITDFGRTPEGYVFIAMELCDGRDLHDEMVAAESLRLPWRRTRRIALQVCAALAAAHEQGVIHRDLKPENIFLTDRQGGRDFVKLLDFGIAKLNETELSHPSIGPALGIAVPHGGPSGRTQTRAGMLIGTPEYMAPEQARGDPIDHRADIYAMGCLLFRMVAGKPPFEADNPMQTLQLQMTAEVPSVAADLATLGAPAEVESVIRRALAKDPADRYASAADLAADLRRVSPGRARDAVTPAPPFAKKPARTGPMAAFTKAPVPVPMPAAKRRRRPWAVAGLAVVVLGAGAAVVYKLAVFARAESSLAVAVADAGASVTPAADAETVTADAGPRVLFPDGGTERHGIEGRQPRKNRPHHSKASEPEPENAPGTDAGTGPTHSAGAKADAGPHTAPARPADARPQPADTVGDPKLKNPFD